jgi:thiol:disulfide interchange protein
MPCVQPVLGLKLMSFAQQSGRARQEVFQMNLWFCAGLFAVFFVLATAAVAANIGLARTNLAWGQQFGSVPFKIGMLGVVFAFALSFLGVWELPIPGFIGEKAGHVQSKEGPLGAFLKGVLSTVLATPCSGPFLGPVFGYTITQPTAVTYVIFGSIALGMSLPYVLVGLFPNLVRFMPKPGAWMATFKEVLGFVMLGTVAYLFYLLRQQPDWFVPTFVMLVAIWMGCWWVGRAQEMSGVIGFGRWVQGATIAAVISSLGFFWLGPHDSLIKWEKPFSPARLAELRREGATVMVDFSADWCLTCKANLQFAIETNRVKAALDKNRVVPVLADWTDGSEEIREVLEGLGSRSIPVLAIYPGSKPGEPLREPIILRDLLTESQVIAALEAAGPSCCPPPEIRAASVAPPPAGR